MNSHNRTSLIFLAFAFLIIGASFIWPQIWGIHQKKNALATVTQLHGQVEKISIHKSESEKIKKGSRIENLETLIVGNNSDLVVRFQEGAEIKLLPGALVNFSGKPKNPQLNIRKGSLEVLTIGSQDKLWISHNGQTIKAQNYQANAEPDLSLDINPLLTDEISTENTKDISNIEGSPETTPSQITKTIANIKISPEKEGGENSEQNQVRTMISDRIARQKTRIYRCYSQLLQKEPEAKGKLTIQFLVNNLGKVEETQTVSSQFKDDGFHKCLTEVIKRTDFLPFKGDTMATLLPLKFEKIR